jgi:hypothetical protein
MLLRTRSAADAPILGFFKEGKTAQIGMGKEDVSARSGSLPASFSPNES